MALSMQQTKIDTNIFSVRKDCGFVLVCFFYPCTNFGCILGLPPLTDLIILNLSNTKLFDYFLCQKDNILKTSHRQFFSCKG